MEYESWILPPQHGRVFKTTLSEHLVPAKSASTAWNTRYCALYTSWPHPLLTEGHKVISAFRSYCQVFFSAQTLSTSFAYLRPFPFPYSMSEVWGVCLWGNSKHTRALGISSLESLTRRTLRGCTGMCTQEYSKADSVLLDTARLQWPMVLKK